jgi:hypothetical protein
MCASTELALSNDYVAAQATRELASDRETESAAVRSPPQGMLRLSEGLEDMIHIAGGDATPRVSYLEVDLHRRV